MLVFVSPLHNNFKKTTTNETGLSLLLSQRLERFFPYCRFGGFELQMESLFFCCSLLVDLVYVLRINASIMEETSIP